MLKKILIIEDNPDLGEIFELAFESNDFQVQKSSEGMDGIVKAMEFQPDIILLDLMMPHVDGYEVLQGIRRHSSVPVPIIVFSNLSQQKDIDRAFEFGATEYLQKSDYRPDQVVEKVKLLLEKSPAQNDKNDDGFGVLEQSLAIFLSPEILHHFTIIKVEHKEDYEEITFEENRDSFFSLEWGGECSLSSADPFVQEKEIHALGKRILLHFSSLVWESSGKNLLLQHRIDERDERLLLVLEPRP